MLRSSINQPTKRGNSIMNKENLNVVSTKRKLTSAQGRLSEVQNKLFCKKISRTVDVPGGYFNFEFQKESDPNLYDEPQYLFMKPEDLLNAFSKVKKESPNATNMNYCFYINDEMLEISVVFDDDLTAKEIKELQEQQAKLESEIQSLQEICKSDEFILREFIEAFIIPAKNNTEKLQEVKQTSQFKTYIVDKKSLFVSLLQDYAENYKISIKDLTLLITD